MTQTERLRKAAQFAQQHEVAWTREVDDKWGVHVNDPAPWNQLLGPIHDRGPASGVVMHQGQQVLSWGEPTRSDLTFSIAKTYLALLAGIAHDDGLLPDVHAPISQRIQGFGFEGAHNRQVTWAQMLQQTSEWTGWCFGLPDQADHYRVVEFAAKPEGEKGSLRPLSAPGAYWEYNDVRINQLSLALLHLFGRPLPEVFEERIMQAVGAQHAWQWVGYDNAWTEVYGRRVPSVPGGTHWGGGVSIAAEDQAKIGMMMLNEGRYNKQQVVSASWLAQMRQPCDLAPYYGYLTWLNTNQQLFSSLPASSYCAIGAGGNFCLVVPEAELVIVARWVDPKYAETLFAQILAAICT